MQHASLEANSLPTTMHPSTTNCKNSASRANNSKLVETIASCSLRPRAEGIATTNTTNNTHAALFAACWPQHGLQKPQRPAPSARRSLRPNISSHQHAEKSPSEAFESRTHITLCTMSCRRSRSLFWYLGQSKQHSVFGTWLFCKSLSVDAIRSMQQTTPIPIAKFVNFKN